MAKDTVEESLRLNIKQFYEYFKNKEVAHRTISWTSGSRINLVVNGFLDIITLDYSIRGQSYNYNIHIGQFYTHNGGYKYLFYCPNCQKQVAIIYKAPSYKYFKCRKCSDLIYNQQKTHNKNADMFKYLGKYAGIAYLNYQTEKLLKRFEKYS